MPHRKIYEQYFGDIPIDEFGRTYEIHHIDGDHSNNSPENLKAVTIQEHYSIHENNGDYYACYLISLRMKKSPEELSRLATLHNEKMVNDGTHPFLGGEMQKRTQNERVNNGSHHLLSGEIQRDITKKRMDDGTHNFLTMTPEFRRNAQNELIAAGNHTFQKPGHYDLVRNSLIGSKNVHYDSTIRHFINKNTGEERECTMNDLYTEFNLEPRNLWAVVKGKRKSCGGWKIK